LRPISAGPRAHTPKQGPTLREKHLPPAMGCAFLYFLSVAKRPRHVCFRGQSGRATNIGCMWSAKLEDYGFRSPVRRHDPVYRAVPLDPGEAWREQMAAANLQPVGDRTLEGLLASFARQR
jgi:hypothetical protein